MKITYRTGRNCKKFTDLDNAKKYADEWFDKSITIYKDNLYCDTIHKNGDIW